MKTFGASNCYFTKPAASKANGAKAELRTEENLAHPVDPYLNFFMKHLFLVRHSPM